MATRDVFSEDEMTRLRSFPEIGRVELIRHFTLTDADEAFLRKFRTGRNVLGAAVQLCALPWLGYVPDDVSSAPAAAVGRLSQRLGVPMGELRDYGARSQTRTDHLREIAAYAGWRTTDAAEWKELDEFLFTRAMEHDSPKLLFRLACEFLISGRVARPGVVHLLEHVATARNRAREEPGPGSSTCSPSGAGPSWTCCWCRTPTWGVPRWPGSGWGRRRRAPPR